MNYPVDRDSRVPAYLLLYSQMRDKIVQGIYPYGSKLPSKRNTADQMRLSIITVEHAYNLLCEEGYVESRERSGYFVIFRPTDGFAATPGQADPSASHSPGQALSSAFHAPGQTDPHVSHTLGQTDPHIPHAPGQEHVGSSLPEFPFSVLARTMRRVLSDYGEILLERSPNSGCLGLRTAISRYLARSKGMQAAPEQIIIGSGSEYLYGLIVELLGRDSVYAIESPSYKKIRQVYQASDVALEMLPLGKDGIESAALWNSQAGILHISPYRSFPSGVTASASKRHEYIRWAAQGKRYLVEDDFESEFSILKKPEETLFSLTDDDNVIYMNTFSQTISPSLRAGYMVLPGHLAPIFKEKLGFYSCTVPTYLQYVLAELIENGDFERHINRVRRAKREKQ